VKPFSVVLKTFPIYRQPFGGVLKTFPIYRQPFGGVLKTFPIYRGSFGGLLKTFPIYRGSFGGLLKTFPFGVRLLVQNLLIYIMGSCDSHHELPIMLMLKTKARGEAVRL
jgi:hypothetical protein